MFKALTLTALFTALLFGAVPCEAAGVRNSSSLNGNTWNGLALNAYTRNGLTLNAYTRNGLTLNAYTRNGLTLNGDGAAGTAGYRIIGVELPSAQ